MRLIILAAVLLVFSTLHTARADTDALASNANIPLAQRYAAVESEIASLLESLQSEYRTKLNTAKQQHDGRIARLYENAPSVFDRSGREKALHRQHRERRGDLDREYNAARDNIHALRATAVTQLSKNGIVAADIRRSINTFDTASADRGGIANSPASGLAGSVGGNDAPPEPGDTNSGITSRPDSGSENRAADSEIDMPRFDQDKGSYTWSDGTMTSAIAPDGSVGKVSDKGDIVFEDGSSVTHTGNQQVTVHSPGGASAQFETGGGGSSDSMGSSQASGALDANTTVDTPKFDSDKGSYTWADGTTVTEIRPDSGVGRINEKGDIVFDDGASIVHGGEQMIIVHESDGSSRTYYADDQGQWIAADGDKGSNKTHAGSSGGRGTGQAGSEGKGKGKGKDSQDNDSGGDDASESSDSDSDKGKDSDADAEADADTDTDSSGEKGKGKGSSKESYGEGGGSYSSGPNAVIQGIVDRASGNSTEADSGVPQPCGDSGALGGSVSQPGAGSSGGCIPAGLPGINADEEEPTTPQASDSVISEDQHRAAGVGISDRIGQPGISESAIPIGDLPSHTPLDQAPVTNPEPGNQLF